MLPSVVPCAVGEGIANFIIGNGVTVVLRQQIAPFVLTVDVGDGALGRSQRTDRVGVFLAVQDVARTVIFPGVGKATCLIILPDQPRFCVCLDRFRERSISPYA